ncbi:MAG: lasso peptide biosynthesis B2 protein [Clostridium sp.]|nr:lasso peptide biosynthesis B2 protein [Clostridium sp.]
MKFFRKLIRLCRFPVWQRHILIEAFFISGLVRFAILFIPFKKLAGFIGKYKRETARDALETEKQITYRVGWAAQKISCNTPWESKCLVKALTAQIMLTRRKISSTLYLGVAKDNYNKLVAHAWLRSGQVIITGAKESVLFKEVARFANYAGRDK